VLHGGVLHQFDSPERLYRSPVSKVVARFLGFDNLVEGVLDENGCFHCPFGMLAPTLPAGRYSLSASRAVTLLLRPEGARLADTAAPSAGLPLIAGVVTASRFLGGAYRLTIDASGELLTFYLPIDPVPPLPEEPVQLCLNPASLVLLADEPSSTPVTI
jgi:ABC-type Fe3+/spermidine/putrescine transport system ATPase subunit